MIQRAESTPSKDPGRMEINCILFLNTHSYVGLLTAGVESRL